MLLTSLSLAASCVSDTVARDVTLMPTEDPALPSGQAGHSDDAITVALAPLEPLVPGAEFVAWARAARDGNLVLLGAFDPASGLSIPAAELDLRPAEISEVLITVEDSGSDLTGGPSGPAYVRGLFPGALESEIPSHEFATAEATAALRDRELTLLASGLPALPPGFSYHLWLAFDSGEEEAHHHGEEHEHDGEVEPGHGAQQRDPVDMGSLVENRTLRASGDFLLGEADELHLSIESDLGVDHMSGAAVLHGRALPESDHEQGGGHMH